MSLELLFDPLFRVPFATGLLLAWLAARRPTCARC